MSEFVSLDISEAIATVTLLKPTMPPALFLELAPGGAHFRPERLGALVVRLAGAEVVVLDALVARHAVLAG